MSGREQQELDGVTLLGNQGTKYPQDYAPQILETFVNKHPENDYFVHRYVQLPGNLTLQQSIFHMFLVRLWLNQSH